MAAPSSLTRADVADAFTRLGLTVGDLVLCHSSLSRIGRTDGGAETVVAALLDVIGTTGTLVTPERQRSALVSHGATRSVARLRSTRSSGATAESS